METYSEKLNELLPKAKNSKNKRAKNEAALILIEMFSENKDYNTIVNWFVKFPHSVCEEFFKQYRITDDAESFSIDDLNDYLLFDINVHPEVLAKRADNTEHAIDIYRKRLNNGGIKLVYDRGTANYKVSDIRVAQSKKDINDSINKLLEEDLKENPIPEAAYDYGVENTLLNMRQ